MQIQKFTLFDLQLNEAGSYDELKANYPEIDAALMTYITCLRTYKGSILSVANAAYEVDVEFQSTKTYLDNREQTDEEDSAQTEEMLYRLRKRYYDLLSKINTSTKEKITALTTASLDVKKEGFLGLAKSMTDFGKEALEPFKSEDIKDFNPELPGKVEAAYTSIDSAFSKLVDAIDKIIAAEESGNKSVYEKGINDFINSWCMKQIEVNKKADAEESDQSEEEVQEKKVLSYDKFINEGKGLRRNMLKAKKKDIKSILILLKTFISDTEEKKSEAEDSRLQNRLGQILNEMKNIQSVLKDKTQWEITRKEANTKIQSIRDEINKLMSSVNDAVLNLTQWDNQIKPIMDEILNAQVEMDGGFSEISKAIYYEDLQTVKRFKIFKQGTDGTYIEPEDLESSKTDKSKQRSVGKSLTKAEMERVKEWAIKEKKFEVSLEATNDLDSEWMKKYGLTDEDKDFLLTEGSTSVLTYREESGQLVMLQDSGYYGGSGMICFTWPNKQYEKSEDPKYRLEGEWKWNGTAPEITWKDVEKFSLPELGGEGNLYTTKGDPYEYAVGEDGGKMTWWFKGRKGYKTNSKYPDWKSLLNNTNAQKILNNRHPSNPIPAENRP